MKRWIFVIAGLVVAVDQLTKVLILKNVTALPLKILPFFNFVLAWNRGISFGILNQHTAWIFWVLTTITITIAIGLFIYACLQKRAQKIVYLSMIIGGAIGNIIDRFWHGAVVDFLDFHIYNYHWPAFNVADSSIVIGVFFLMLDSYFHDKKHTV